MKFLIFAAAIILGSTSTSFADTQTGAPFSVLGERLDISPPQGWKLAWMQGTPEGEYLVEYIPEHEDINSWKTGYLLVVRKPYPPAELMKEIAEMKTRFADLSLIQTINFVAKNCPDKHEPTSQRTNTFNGVYFAVGGGCCSLARDQIPFGEGAFIAFAEGKDFVYKIQYGWRPQSESEKRSSPWGIDEEKSKLFLMSIRSATLCDDSKSNCKNTYTKSSPFSNEEVDSQQSGTDSDYLRSIN